MGRQQKRRQERRESAARPDLVIDVAHDLKDGRVIVKFNQPLDFVVLDRQYALALAELITIHASTPLGQQATVAPKLSLASRRSH